MEFINRNPSIYVLSGKAGSGKSFIADKMKCVLEFRGLKCISIAYASYLKNYIMNITDWDGSEERKPREFLQELGVDLIKNRINSSMLIDRIVDDISVYSYFFDVIIVSDARFIDEIEVIRDKFSRVCVINVVGGSNNLSDREKSHITETALDNYNDYDFVIYNDDFLDDNVLDEQIEEVLR